MSGPWKEIEDKKKVIAEVKTTLKARKKPKLGKTIMTSMVGQCEEITQTLNGKGPK